MLPPEAPASSPGAAAVGASYPQPFSPSVPTREEPGGAHNLGTWLKDVQVQIERTLEKLLKLADEEGLGPTWSQALEHLRSYSLRASKRLRPGLVLAGYTFARGDNHIPQGLWRFAAATELLHSFMLIHDDVADQADIRRGGATLHKLLGGGKLGEDLAIIAGDHLFSRALEIMLTTNLPNTTGAVKYYLSVCRHTAAGQFMDITFSQRPLHEIPLFQALKVATLKTALYGFTAPLVCGAMLGKGDPTLIAHLDSLGRHIGVAYQLRDDLIGLYGQAEVAGKSTDSDIAQGKRTFPVVAAYTRASPEHRRELEVLLTPGPKDLAMLNRARELVELNGGRKATEQIVQRSTRLAERILPRLPEANGLRTMLGQLVQKLVNRNA